MKKILLVLFCIMFASNIFGQKIYLDKLDNNIRTISSQYISIGKLGFLPGVKLKCSLDLETNLKLYTINLILPYVDAPKIDEGRILLFKSDSGEIFEMKCFKTVDILDYTYKVERFGTFYKTIYHVTPSYIITEDMIQQIINSRIVKMRVETNVGENDWEIGRNKLSEAIKKSYNMIEAQLKIKKDRYSDF